MKLMFASDIHGSLPATERVLSLFEQSGAQWLIILGDVLNHGPRNALPEGYAPAQVAEKLNQYADKIIAVRGNCDSEVDQMLLHFPISAPWQQVLLEDCLGDHFIVFADNINPFCTCQMTLLHHREPFSLSALLARLQLRCNLRINADLRNNLLIIKCDNA